MQTALLARELARMMSWDGDNTRAINLHFSSITKLHHSWMPLTMATKNWLLPSSKTITLAKFAARLVNLITVSKPVAMIAAKAAAPGWRGRNHPFSSSHLSNVGALLVLYLGFFGGGLGGGVVLLVTTLD
jgi:hypothetical protein